jgi:glutathione S-transferase
LGPELNQLDASLIPADPSATFTERDDTIRSVKAALCAWLDGSECFESRLTAGDPIMTTVLRELVASGVLSQFPILDAYQRCEARPAFGRAQEARMQPFRENAPA